MAKQDTFDFHKVAENAEVEVYQAMQRYKTKETVNDAGATIPAPIKYGPLTLKTVDAASLGDALGQFKGYDIDNVTISKTEGIVVRIRRGKGDVYEPKEPNVERLKQKGGDA